ncbi:MAG: DUF305 domain-containing protein [Pseudomonadota bacterium]
MLTPEQATEVANLGYSPYDVVFMQDMIPHHHQATQMSALVKGRTSQPDVVEIAARIDASQGDEIQFMQDWLRERGEEVTEPSDHHAMHMHHDMAGMATPEQMAALAEAGGVDFDRMFLELMIAHHEGAITMVEDLLSKKGSAYEPIIHQFVNDVVNDQTAEIERMNTLLVGLSEDPRATLKAGLTDAGEAILHLEKTSSLPNPPGFFDPDNPGGLPLEYPEARASEASEPVDTRTRGAEQANWEERAPMMSFWNSDLAFSGDLMVAGSYHGFNMYRLKNADTPELISSIVCPGGQGDVSIVGDLLIMSVEQTRGRVDCGLQGVNESVSEDRFRGIRIFDISDPVNPEQVGLVQTCRGSHTHSVVAGPDRKGNIIVYNSGIQSVRSEEELPGCIGEEAGDERTALFRIDVIEIPMDDPAKARIVDSPTVFADPESGRMAGLWAGGDHGEGTQETERTDQCHDITVFPEEKIAAGACQGNGIVLDISNPRKPKRIDDVTDVGFAYWHSATFNNDASKVLFTDEWGAGSRPRCRAFDKRTWGANAIYDLVDNKLEFRSYYKLPAPQVDQENCVAHNGSLIPVPGRDIFAQAWYQGGLSISDFTDSSKPMEIAYFDRGPVDEKLLVTGGYWSTYWYNGRIYGTEIARGLDVFKLEPSEFLTENEIAAAELGTQGPVFNPQQQLRYTWPAVPVVALAYVDQLKRGDALAGELVSQLEEMLSKADARLDAGELDRELSASLKSLAKDIGKIDVADAHTKRQAALSDTLDGIAKQLAEGPAVAGVN